MLLLKTQFKILNKNCNMLLPVLIILFSLTKANGEKGNSPMSSGMKYAPEEMKPIIFGNEAENAIEEDIPMDIFAGVPNPQEMDEEQSENDYYNGYEPPPPRKKRKFGRPRNNVKKLPDFTDVKCSSTLDMNEEGFVQFYLTPSAISTEECGVDLIGSQFYKCTVALYCSELRAPKPDSGGICSFGYIEVSDGFGGVVVGCGDSMELNNGFKSSKGGKDLYLRWRGVSGDHANCMAFCEEDKKFFSVAAQRETKELPPSPVGAKGEIGSCLCGRKNVKKGRIVGGEDAIPFEFPWIAAMVESEAYKAKYPDRDIRTRSNNCGASLISDRHAITAAHCFGTKPNAPPVDPESLDLLFHAHVLDLDKEPKQSAMYHNKWTSAEYEKHLMQTPGINATDATDKDENSLRIRIKKIQKHPLFDGNTFDYDVTILHLHDRINLAQFSKFITPVCLSKPGQWVSPKEKDIMEIAGWGLSSEFAIASTRILQKAKVPVLAWQKCADRLASNKLKLNARLMCAGYEKGQVDACEGDSGSAAYILRDSVYYQAGVVSSGIGCARPRIPGFYTNFNEIQQWVHYYTKNGRKCGHEKKSNNKKRGGGGEMEEEIEKRADEGVGEVTAADAEVLEDDAEITTKATK